MARTVTYLHQFLVNRDFSGSVILDLPDSPELAQMHDAFRRRDELAMLAAYGRFLEVIDASDERKALIAAILDHIRTIQSEADYASLIYDLEATAPKSKITGTVQPLWRLDVRRLRIIRDLARNREKRKLEKALAEGMPVMFLTPPVRLTFPGVFDTPPDKGETMSAPDAHHDSREAAPYHLENLTRDLQAAYASAEESSKRNTELLMQATDAACEAAVKAGHSKAIVDAIKNTVAQESAQRTLKSLTELIRAAKR